jgi:hypothetical protein
MTATTTESAKDRKRTVDREPARKWPHDFAGELDATPPDDPRELIEEVVNLHLPQDQSNILKITEQSEGEGFARPIEGLRL